MYNCLGLGPPSGLGPVLGPLAWQEGIFLALWVPVTVLLALVWVINAGLLSRQISICSATG